jgi:hypothetical protein
LSLKLLEFLEFQKHLEDICLALILGDRHVLGEHMEIPELICVYSKLLLVEFGSVVQRFGIVDCVNFR